MKVFTVEAFDELQVFEYEYPRIVIPIIAPADADEGAYVASNRFVGAYPTGSRQKHAKKRGRLKGRTLL